MSTVDIQKYRIQIAMHALQGLLATETEDYGISAVYLDPQGKETWARQSLPLRENGQPDYTKPSVPHKLLRTVEQERAKQAVANADALLQQLGYAI